MNQKKSLGFAIIVVAIVGTVFMTLQFTASDEAQLKKFEGVLLNSDVVSSVSTVAGDTIILTYFGSLDACATDKLISRFARIREGNSKTQIVAVVAPTVPDRDVANFNADPSMPVTFVHGSANGTSDFENGLAVGSTIVVERGVVTKRIVLRNVGTLDELEDYVIGHRTI